MREVLDLIPANARRTDAAAGLGDMRFVVVLHTRAHGPFGLATFRYLGDAERYAERYEGLEVELREVPVGTQPDAIEAARRRERAAVAEYLRQVPGCESVAPQVAAWSGTSVEDEPCL